MPLKGSQNSANVIMQHNKNPMNDLYVVLYFRNKISQKA